ncbi:enoyl-CoA hydratase-related protein [Paraburkholderia sp. RL18-101-BIB-B]|uniref:enoyl-CoA hydratase/isomerase family protein n=1 Tax=Paraburkholderia sp. RL18-101-BIB-B TaxID=3031634 RepID=UPI0038BC4F52
MSVRTEIKDHVASITIDRPEAFNAIDSETGAALLEAWTQASASEEVRVIVLTGAGSRAFCVGADLKKTRPPSGSAPRRHFRRIPPSPVPSDLRCVKPVIAAINGFALGGGLEIALQCDIRIASSNAAFGLPEVSVGSIPGAGGTQRLIRAVGTSDAMLMLLGGDRIDAQEALRIGLVSRVVPPEELATTTHAIASRIAANAPLAVLAVKELATTGRDVPLPVGLELERQSFSMLLSSEDRIEGRLAFAEKRRPIFKGD